MPFYAVAAGKAPGIYKTWDEAQTQITGFSGAVHKKFPSVEQAQAFIDKHSIKIATTPSTTRKRARDDGEPKFYAVARGRATGIYRTWPEVVEVTKGQKYALYRKFATREEAERFLMTHGKKSGAAAGAAAEVTVEVQPGDPDPRDPSTLVAFSDGSALKNGFARCRAGWATVFPHNEAWNVAEKIEAGRMTNNAAEYLAALAAMRRANIEDPACAKPLYIFSDSMLLINSMTQWVDNWRARNWVKSDGQAVKNANLLAELVAARQSRRIIWRHVKAHTTKKDWASMWNDKADRMARDAAAS